MDANEAIRIVKSKSRGRTRYEGQEPFLDEVLVAEIERLTRENAELKVALGAISVTPTGGTCKQIRKSLEVCVRIAHESAPVDPRIRELTAQMIENLRDDVVEAARAAGGE